MKSAKHGQEHDAAFFWIMYCRLTLF